VVLITLPPYKPPESTHPPVQVVNQTATPGDRDHPGATSVLPIPQTTNPPTAQFGTGGVGRWSIQASTSGHQYSGHDQSTAQGEWGRAYINPQGVVGYRADSSLIGASAPGAGDQTSTTTSTFVAGSSGSHGGATNPGGHTLNNNGAIHGNAWWKHAVPGTSEVVTEQIESRSHNEFYDVFKDGQYVGTYQISADAEHFTRDAYRLWHDVKNGPKPNRGWQEYGAVQPAVDQWNLANVHVAKLPPEPPSAPSDVPDLNDDPNGTDDQTSDGSVRIDLDEQVEEQKTSLQNESGPEKPAAITAPADVDAIARALQAVAAPDQSGPDAHVSANPSGDQQQAENPTPEQIADSLAQISGDLPQSANQFAQTAPPSQDPAQAQGVSVSAAPSSDEIAAATEQVIASATPPAQSPAPTEESAKPEDQDPLRENPPEPSVSNEDSAPSEEVLAEEPPQALDQQQDDDLPPLG
jgi:hypothetical protein